MAADTKLVVMLKLDGTELGKGISRAQADIAKIGAAFTGIGAAATAAVKFTATFQDQTIKAARAAGMASQSFSSLAYAAGLGGVGAQELGKSMVKLQNPTADASRTFRDLGIQMRDSTGKVRDQSSLLTDLADKFEGITDPAIKSQAALRIFGEEGVKMVSMLEGGSAALKAAREEAYAFGQTVSKQAGENAEKFNDDISKVSKGLTGFRNVVSESAIEVANQSGAMEKAQAYLKSAIEWWRGLSKETKDSTIRFITLTATLGGLLLTLSAIAAALPSLAAGFALLTGPIGLVSAGIAALTLGVNEYKEATKKGSEAQLQWMATAGPMGQTIAGLSKLYDELTAKALINNVATNAGAQIYKKAEELRKKAEEERLRKKRESLKNVKLSDAPSEIQYKSEVIQAIQEVELAKAKARGVSQKGIDEIIEKQKIEAKGYTSTAQQASIAYAKVAESIAKVAANVVKPFSDLTDTIAKGIEYDSQVAMRDLDVVANRAAELYAQQRAAMEAEETAKIAALESSYDSQIQAVQDGEDAKTRALEAGANARLLAADAEYAAALEKLNQSYAAQLAADQADYEMKTAILDQRALDKEQRQLTEDIMQADRDALAQLREQEHQKAIADLAGLYADKKKGIDNDQKAAEKTNAENNKLIIEELTKNKNAALEAAEAEKNAKLGALDKARAAQEKDIEKQRLETQYKAQLDAFHTTKAVKIAETVASGVAAAAQAFAALAPIPFVGIGLGAAAAGIISTAMAMRVGKISSQEPIKPAGLLEDGGVIGGNMTHAQGGIPANVESGEMFIDRRRTAKMLGFIDNATSGGGGVTINIQAGAIQGDIRDEATLTKLATKLGNLISRRMVFAT